jgi:hypothetical protein
VDLVANLLSPPYPKKEQHSVEEVFENVLVQQIKPFWVKLNEQSDDGNAQNVKNINAYPPQWNKPTLLLELSKR